MCRYWPLYGKDISKYPPPYHVHRSHLRLINWTTSFKASRFFVPSAGERKWMSYDQIQWNQSMYQSSRTCLPEPSLCRCRDTPTAILLSTLTVSASKTQEKCLATVFFQDGRISLLDFRFADDDSTLAHANYVAQCFKEPLVETCPGVSGKMKEKNWKTNKHMGFADTNVLPMEMLGRMGGNSIDYIWHSIWTVPMQGLNITKVGREHTLAFLPSPSHKEKTLPKNPDRTCQTTRRVSWKHEMPHPRDA